MHNMRLMIETFLHIGKKICVGNQQTLEIRSENTHSRWAASFYLKQTVYTVLHLKVKPCRHALICHGVQTWSTKWQDENQNRVEEPMNTNQHINSIKEQNNLQINRQNMLFRKKTNLEKEFGIFPFSSAWDCIELMSRRTIYKEKETGTHTYGSSFSQTD